MEMPQRQRKKEICNIFYTCLNPSFDGNASTAKMVNFEDDYYRKSLNPSFDGNASTANA